MIKMKPAPPHQSCIEHQQPGILGASSAQAPGFCHYSAAVILGRVVVYQTCWQWWLWKAKEPGRSWSPLLARQNSCRHKGSPPCRVIISTAWQSLWILVFPLVNDSLRPVLNNLPVTVRLGQGKSELVLHLQVIEEEEEDADTEEEEKEEEYGSDGEKIHIYVD